MEYRIAIIDDRESEILYIKHVLKPEFLLEKVELSSNLEDMVKDLLEKKVDAVIIDYELSATQSNIHFKGDNVVLAIRNIKTLFPISVLTAFSEQAENASIDPDIVYDKETILNNPATFKRKLAHKIQNYKSKIDELRKELVELNLKETLSLKEEERLIELDKILEKELESEFTFPNNLKTSSNYAKLEELIKLSKNIIERIDRNAN